MDWDGTEIKAAVFMDMLALPESAGSGVSPNVQEAGIPVPEAASGVPEVLARYANGVYEGEPALIRNRCGAGEAYYFGSTFTEETAAVFLKKLGIAEPFGDLLELPAGVELAVRAGEDGRKYLFLLNYDKASARITVKKAMKNLFGDEPQVWQGEQELPGYGVAVLKV